MSSEHLEAANELVDLLSSRAETAFAEGGVEAVPAGELESWAELAREARDNTVELMDNVDTYQRALRLCCEDVSKLKEAQDE